MKSTTIYFVPEYNFSESNYVKCVIDTNDLDVTHHEHVPSTGKPSSVTRVYKNGSSYRSDIMMKTAMSI